MCVRHFSCPLSRLRSLTPSISASGQWRGPPLTDVAHGPAALVELERQQLRPTQLYSSSLRVDICFCGFERAIVLAATDRTGADIAALGHWAAAREDRRRAGGQKPRRSERPDGSIRPLARCSVERRAFSVGNPARLEISPFAAPAADWSPPAPAGSKKRSAVFALPLRMLK